MPAPSVLVALDLDGTLLDDHSRLSPGHRRAVHDLHRLGAAVALVTGRPLLTTTWVWRELRLTTPIVCFNGAWVGTCGRPAPARAPGAPAHDPGTTWAGAPLAEPEVRWALATLHRALAGQPGANGAICAYPDAGTWLIDRVTTHTKRWSERYQVPIGLAPARFADWRGPSWKLMYVAEPAVVAHALPALRAGLCGRCEVVVSQPDRVEILPRGITKAWGLAHLARHLGIPQARVWAVGDADNDREMVAWAGHGCAMGQAPEGLRRLARRVLPGVDARGLCALVPLVAAELATGARA
jgi:hydroxymethylpyrimidine pyrophosphatase-like HAD family hydrolase